MLFLKKIYKYQCLLRDAIRMAYFNFFERPLFRHLGNNISLKKDYRFLNHHYISIGNNFTALERLRMEAIGSYADSVFNPSLVIGHNVIFNTDIHIGCIDSVRIGDNVLLASRIFISDHSHGSIDAGALLLPPNQRPLISKGPVVIEDNVWLGEGVCVLPGVTIGRNSIIGANSVVVSDCESNAVYAGVPARLIKRL